jgi:uncharacterized repeat protein (TIGR03847 family)
MSSYDFEYPDVFTAGTIGEVGNRTFLVQARHGSRTVTVKVEKQQLRALADYLAEAINGLGRPGHLDDPEGIIMSPDDLIDITAGEISVSIDPERGHVEIVMEDIDPKINDDALICVSKEQAAAFAIAAIRLVESGRPPCPLCGLPLDPRGHDCPRTNGHRAPLR